MNSVKKKVSIIIPVHDGGHVVKRAIESCLVQDYKNVEIIVVDNNSTDNTREVVLSFAKKTNKVKYFYTNLKGRSNARNIGLSKATGDYIKFLDADDKLSNLGVKKSVNFLDKNTNFFAVCGTIEYVNELKGVKKKVNIDTDISNLQFRNLFPINAILLRNERLVPFDTQLEYCEDWLFWFDNLWGKNIKVNNSIFAGQVFINGENSMGNIRIMTRYRSIVRVAILSKINYKSSTLRNDIKYCLAYLWSYRKNENHDEKLDQYMVDGYGILFKVAKCVYNFAPFRILYDKRKNNQEHNNYYFKN